MVGRVRGGKGGGGFGGGVGEQVHCRVSESIVHSTFYLAPFLQGEIYQTAE